MQPKLKLIEGGLGPKENAKKSFVSAFVTDTRLMGQMVMGIHWNIVDHPEADDLYQFFSFDAEELGLDDYRSVWDGDVNELDLIRQTMIGPLGGKDVIINENEAKALFTEFFEKRKMQGLAFLEGMHEFKFLIEQPVYLTDEDSNNLLSKMCTKIKSANELINYYLMRLAAKDKEAASLLTTDGAYTDIFDDIPQVTLLKNTIHKQDDHYISHSLVEHDAIYKLLVSDITVTPDFKIASSERADGMNISYQEAALMLSEPEFITSYQIITGPEEFEDSPLEFNYNTITSEHVNGRMYMAFNVNNDHVDSDVFRLSNDVFGVYFITYNGEFIVSAKSMAQIMKMERDLLHTRIGAFLIPTGKFEFQEPVLLQFAESDFYYFGEFVEAITEGE